MYEDTRINQEIRDWFKGTGLVARAGSQTVWIKNIDGVNLGSGPNFGSACMAALQNREAEDRHQAISFAFSLSFGAEELFEAIDDQFGEDDEEGDEDEEAEEEEEEEEEEGVSFRSE